MYLVHCTRNFFCKGSKAALFSLVSTTHTKAGLL